MILAAFAAGIGLGIAIQSGDNTGSRATRTETAPKRAVATSVPGSLTKALDAVPIPETLAGTGTMTGEVVDSDGHPMAGVRILAQPESPPTGKRRSRVPAPPAAFDAVEYVRSTVGLRLWKERSSRWATSDSDGKFKLEAIADHNYSVWAYGKGHSFSATPSSYRRRPGHHVRFVGTSIIRLPIEITVNGDSEAETAKVIVRRDRGERHHNWTRSEPWIEISPGALKIRATVRVGEVEGQSEELNVEVRAGDTATPLRIDVRMRATLRASVKSPSAFAGVTTSVALQRTDDTGEFAQPNMTHTSLSDKDGIHIWRGLEPGVYRARAWLRGVSAGEWEPIELPAGLTEMSLAAAAPDPASHLVVRILSPDGTPLDKIQFAQTYRHAGGSTHRGWNPGTRRADGTIFLRPIKGADAKGQYEVHARSPSLGTLRRPVTVADTAPVTLRFEEPVRAMIRIPGAIEAGCREKLRVTVHEVTEPGISPHGLRDQGILDDQARIRARPLQPDDYKIAVWIATSDDDWALLMLEQVGFTPRMEHLDLRLPTLSTVRVHWRGKRAAKIGLRSTDRSGSAWRGVWHAPVEPGATGEFAFVPPGKYRVVAYGSKSAAVEIEVPAQVEVSLP